MKKRALWKFLIYLLNIAFLLFLLLPLFEMIFTSLRPLEEVFIIPHPLITHQFYVKTYTEEMWKTVPLLPRYLLNSLLISSAVTFICVVLASLAGYALARFKFPGRKIILFCTLSINMFSPVILLVPLYKVMGLYYILDTYYALILPGSAFALPFCIWMLTGYFENIPKVLEEAAMVDGASNIKTLTRVVLPLATPGLVTVAAYAFIVSWGQQFIFSLVFVTTQEMMPITRGLYEYFGRNIVYWNQMMAASIIAILPVLLIFIFLQKYLIKGLTAGAVKG